MRYLFTTKSLFPLLYTPKGSFVSINLELFSCPIIGNIGTKLSIIPQIRCTAQYQQHSLSLLGAQRAKSCRSP